MSKVTLTHELPDGTIATRTTARDYDYLVIGRTDLVKEREELAELWAVDASNYLYFERILKEGVGGTFRYSSRMSAVVTQEMYDEASAAIEGFETVKCYQQGKASDRVAKHNQLHGSNPAGDWKVLAWSGRLDLADKQAAKFSALRNMRDVQVQKITKAP